ncbi:MAG: sigma-70 family RNA polymerase sigma factor [Planctomycetota bacterium]
MTSQPTNDPTGLLADVDFVRGVARQLCRNASDAEDLAQETLQRAIEVPAGQVTNRRGWLTTVARNLAYNARRGEARRKRREQERTARHVPSTEEVVAQEQQRQLVVEAVLALPEKYRAVILLRHFRGLDTAGSAAELGLQESAVRTRISRAIHMLREHLDRRHGGDRDKWLAALAPLTLPLPKDSLTITVAAGAGGSKKATAIVAATLFGLAAATATLWLPTGETAPPDPARMPPQTRTSASATNGGTLNDRTLEVGMPLAAERTLGTPTLPSANEARAFAYGVVKNPSGTIADFRVEATIRIGEDQTSAGDILLGTFQSDANGTFRIPLKRFRELSLPAQSQAHLVCNATRNGFASARDSCALAPIAKQAAGAPAEPDLTCKTTRSQEILGSVRVADGSKATNVQIVCVVDDGTGDSVMVEGAMSDGSFALDADGLGEPGMLVYIYAIDPKHGTSQPTGLRLVANGHMRIAPLILRPSGASIEGQLLWPDGQPAAGQYIEITPTEQRTPRDETLPEACQTPLGRLQILEEHGGEDSLVTDADGRIYLKAARPGRYEISLEDDAPFEVTVFANQRTKWQRTIAGSSAPHFEGQQEPGQLTVQVVDQHGLRLPDAICCFRTWRGEAGRIAAARYQREGASSALIATAEDCDLSYQAEDLVAERGGLSPAPTDTFYLVEAIGGLAGPAYGACHLQPGQHRGHVQITLRKRANTGSARIRVLATNGNPVETVWAKFSRTDELPGLPIRVASQLTGPSPPSQIAGSWHALPASGRITDLPAGTVSVELLAAPKQQTYAVVSPWRIAHHRFEVTKGACANVQISLAQDVPVQLKVHAANREERINAVRIELVSIADGRSRHDMVHTLVQTEAYRSVSPNGEITVADRFYPPGEYELVVTCEPAMVDAAASDDRLWRRQITLREGLLAPIDVRLRPAR